MVSKPKNGVLVGDKAEDFYLGLKLIYQKRKRFQSAKIRQNAMGFTWKNIVENNLGVYLKNLNKNHT